MTRLAIAAGSRRAKTAQPVEGEASQSGQREAMASPNAFTRLIDDLLSIETPAMAWLRENGPIARRLNEEARND
jgi:hypothetical protein